jgi:hypothetical protein
MRQVIASVLVMGYIATPVSASPAQGGAATGTTAIRACSVLTKEMVAPFSPNKQVLDVIKPTDEPMGSGSACNWDGVRLQLFPAPRAKQTRTPRTKDMKPLSGTGEAAYFRSNRDQYAELAIWTATHYLMLQVSVPMGSTAEAIKPNTVTLANAIIAKLR